jgi:zinc protease
MSISRVLLLGAVAASVWAGDESRGPAAVECVAGKGSYAVVVSRATHGDAVWRQVVEALRTKHEASVIVYPNCVWEARAALRRLFPRYACFVVRPEEAGRDFVVTVHRLTRQLDDDPYTDVLWGILTGYEAADALRIAQLKEPLVITRGAAGTGMNLDVFDAGCVYSEGERGVMWEKKLGGPVERKTVEPDTTQALVDAFNTFQTQLFLTSGHATTKDWQIGYSYKNGQFRCRDGQLFGLDLQGKVHPIQSPNPKVFLPVGNCLIGWIPERDCMALAMMRTGGVAQMIGYTVPTWHGFGGWGLKDLFVDLPGRTSLAEAFYVNTQALIHRLVTEFPGSVGVNCEAFDLEKDPHLLGKLAWKHGLVDPATRQLRSRDELGLLWDRDTVAFYGDPAWDARLKPRPLPWETRLAEKDGVYTFELVAHAKSGRSRPPLHFLPHRVQDVKVIEGAEYEPLITDNFLLLPKPAEFEQGKTYRVVFRARPATPDASAGAAVKEAVARLPAEYQAAVAQALDRAWPNEAQLIAAIRAVKPEHREGLAFLLANMPDRDLRSLSKGFLVENIELAYRARDEAPWGKSLPKELFLNYVLPYASVNERRDHWRKDFHERFLPLVRDCKTSGEAALRLNQKVFEVLGVKYHPTQRPKPDQSPSESIKAGVASCTGLSILLIDACRAAAVPARFVGTPQWVGREGNHSWVEVWDREWHFLGAAEATPLDQTWFAEPAEKADPTKVEHRIYAVSFARTPIVFPLVWNPFLDEVRAVDVTSFYTTRRRATP